MPQKPDETRPRPGNGPRQCFEVVVRGRVNLIGEHTDYNDGLVLPIAVERGIRLAVSRREDRLAVLRSRQETSVATIDLRRPIEADRRDWTAYPAGVLAGCRDLGWDIPGFEAVIDGDLPAGAGLGSSAALEVAVATAVETLCGLSLGPKPKALLCQQAEHGFAGVPCGIMDQFAVTCGRRGHALLLDCRSGEIRHVPLDEADVAVLVVDSGVRHALDDGRYAARRRQCEEAARLLGVRSLRDVTPARWAGGAASLPAIERARAAHVLGENDRVMAFAAALGRCDRAAAGRLMGESHESLRRDYEVSCRELDLIVAAASAVPGVHGCRMTGGGFGGCAVALVDGRRAEDVRTSVERACEAVLGRTPATFLSRAAGGPEVRPLHGTAAAIGLP